MANNKTMSQENKSQSQEIFDLLEKDSQIREEIIKYLAQNHPQDFLSKVKIGGDKSGKSLMVPVHSDKEWQE